MHKLLKILVPEFPPEGRRFAVRDVCLMGDGALGHREITPLRAMSQQPPRDFLPEGRDVGGGVVTGSYTMGVAAEKGCETVAQQTFGPTTVARRTLRDGIYANCQ